MQQPCSRQPVTFADAVSSWSHGVLSGLFCVLVQMGRKVGVPDKVQTEIWIFPKPRMTVPGLTLQIWAPLSRLRQALLLGFGAIIAAYLQISWGSSPPHSDLADPPCCSSLPTQSQRAPMQLSP